MKFKHDTSDAEEHRIVVSMTALEAELLLKKNPTVEAELRFEVRKNLENCDHRILAKHRA